MASLNSTTAALGTGELNPPPGIELRTQEERDLYRATLEFERFFVQQLLKDMQKSAKLLGDEQGAGGGLTGSTSGYSDMAQDQLVQSVLDGGGLGLAGILYSQVAASAGIPQGTSVSAGGGAA